MGFLEAIRKYDKSAAQSRGKQGKTKTLLGYGQIWIAKRVREFLSVERFGLNQDAALDRNRVLRAKAALAARLQRPASMEEITIELDRLARAKLAEKGIHAPNARQLWRGGALNVDRVKELDSHVTSRLSLDAPTGTDEVDAPTVATYVAAPDVAADRGLEDADQVAQVDGAVRRHGSRNKRMAVRMATGLRTEAPAARFHPYNLDEIGLFMGRTREAVAMYQDDFRASVQGEVVVSVDRLQVPGTNVTLPDLHALTEIPDAVRTVLAAVVPLWELAKADGARVTPRSLGSRLPCPLCQSEEPVLQVGTMRFSCTACGKRGDAVDWMMAARGATLGVAAAELGRLALRLPTEALREEGQRVVVTRDPVRRRRLRNI